MNGNDKKAIELKRRLSAFSSFIERGMEYIEKYYPDQADWVKENKDKPFDVVVDLIDQEFLHLAD